MWWCMQNYPSYNKQMLLIRAERVWDWTRLGGQGDPLGIVQEVKIWPYE